MHLEITNVLISSGSTISTVMLSLGLYLLQVDHRPSMTLITNFMVGDAVMELWVIALIPLQSTEWNKDNFGREVIIRLHNPFKA
ncbi:hypothetical protein NPIL_75621 [Nephila pilipes]|uniref:Uncharacterized protein n=1 Tax=Nephila pilipes TaxID=299642 RepID=A0A8X6MWZ0_NEPPI|nr:hypothetical protein NPIL_75621 [Nephila pilipes]